MPRFSSSDRTCRWAAASSRTQLSGRDCCQLYLPVGPACTKMGNQAAPTPPHPPSLRASNGSPRPVHLLCSYANQCFSSDPQCFNSCWQPHFIGCRDVLEPLFSIWLLVHVRVELAGQLAIRALDGLLVCASNHKHEQVIVFPQGVEGGQSEQLMQGRDSSA